MYVVFKALIIFIDNPKQGQWNWSGQLCASLSKKNLQLCNCEQLLCAGMEGLAVLQQPAMGEELAALQQPALQGCVINSI